MSKEINPFKQILSDEILPDKHKNQVLTTVDAALLLLDFADLFTFKQAETYYRIVETVTQPSTNNK